MTHLRRLALVTAVATYLLIVFGAIVRTTNSGMGCGPDWPLCNGRLLPTLDPTTIIEWTHRLLVLLASPAILAVVAAAWLWGRSRRDVLLPATAIPVLLAIQIGLGRVVVLLDLQTTVVMVHLMFAFMLLGLIVWVAVAAGPASVARGPRPGPRLPTDRFERLLAASVAATFGLLFIGAYVRASGAGWACIGFPGCNGQALPFGAHPLIDLHLIHRLAGYLVAGLLVATGQQAWRLRRDAPAIPRVVTILVGLVMLQIGVGAVAVSTGPGVVVQSAHLAGATAVWALVVALAGLAWRARRPASAEERGGAKPEREAPGREVATAYVALTKPRVMSLLLITTLAAMLIARPGLPSPLLILFTLLGGALAAGGAGALNHYLDRDIDHLMGRTTARPIPAGLVPPEHALAFGITLGALSFLVFGTFVNFLSAALALVALLFYVFVYTRWLKRLTAVNIVIGGAAGAVPPVVGMAAVTNEVSALALYLFAIIFIWTPPHFWALALLMRREYEAAGVPMLPVVRGDDHTRRQILGYSLAMAALTVAVVSHGLLGSVYLVSAAVLGGLFIYYAIRLLREASAAAARRLFRYSIVYLALLFAAMAADRQLLG